MLTAVAKRSIIALLISAPVFATPVPDTEEIQNLVTRGTAGAVLTLQRDSESVADGLFVLENNLWGQSAATSGSQSSQVTATKGSSVTWKTAYNWVGNPDVVKSFANLDLKSSGLGQSLDSISSIPTSWKWSYTQAGSGLIADVAYDMWLSDSADSTGASSDSTYEVMIWLSARGGATPSGSQIATAKINGVAWKLYKGTVKNWTIFSFLAPNEITNFNVDLKHFFTYLTSKQGVPSSQFLVQMQAGTEPFVGSATLKSSYSASIN